MWGQYHIGTQYSAFHCAHTVSTLGFAAQLQNLNGVSAKLHSLTSLSGVSPNGEEGAKNGGDASACVGGGIDGGSDENSDSSVGSSRSGSTSGAAAMAEAFGHELPLNAGE